MAKKLNKKVALIGSAVFLMLMMFGIALFLYMSRDPEKYLNDADAAFAQQDYETAERLYRRAHGLFNSDEDKIQTLYKLADVFRETDEWRKVLGSWDGISKLDPKKIDSRLNQLTYYYIMADTGTPVWKEVEEKADELLELASEKGRLNENKDQFIIEELFKTDLGEQELGNYLTLIRGRARLEMTIRGTVTDRENMLNKAVTDFEAVLQNDPENVSAYLYLASAARHRGVLMASVGGLDQRARQNAMAMEMLTKAAEISTDDPTASIRKLTFELQEIVEQGGAAAELQAFEPKYIQLVERFSDHPQAHFALAEYYNVLGKDHIQEAASAIKQAKELADNDEIVRYMLPLANYNYMLASIKNQKEKIDTAIDIAMRALELPGAQDVPGPRNYSHRMNKINLHIFLAKCTLEQVLGDEYQISDQKKQELLSLASEQVHEIEQFFGSGENPHVMKWQGMLQLAQGDRANAINKLYAAFERLKSADQADGHIAYVLAREYMDTTELGAVGEFLTAAVSSNYHSVRPQVLLDYAEVLVRLRSDASVSVIEFFENNFGRTADSQRILLKSLIVSKQFDKAEQVLFESDLGEAEKLRAKLDLNAAKFTELMRAVRMEDQELSADQTSSGENSALKAETDLANENYISQLKELLTIAPDLVQQDDITRVFNYFRSEGQFEKADGLVSAYLEHFPNVPTVQFYKKVLNEPDPANISNERAIELQAIVNGNIEIETQREMALGLHYRNQGQDELAASHFKAVLESDGKSMGSEELENTRKQALENLFELALIEKDFEKAEQLATEARRLNIDGCNGMFFAGRIDMEREQYSQAVTKFNECLQQRPVFSMCYMLRSRANLALGNEHEAVQDARKAASWNPLSPNVAKNLANIYIQRNERAGSTMTAAQQIEARTALERAIALNPQDQMLLNFYSNYISTTEPMRALAIRQNLLRVSPSVENAVMLGNLATELAQMENDSEQQRALFEMAGSAFEQAKQIDPTDDRVLYSYAQYYKAQGMDETAQQLLEGSENKLLLWNHYYQSGRNTEALSILEELYVSGEKNSSVLKGLMLVHARLNNFDLMKQYSDDLIEIEDTEQNRLIQIQEYLRYGMIHEAEMALESFNENYPASQNSLLLEASLRMRQGQLAQSLELVNQNLEINDSNPQVWQLRGELNLMTNNFAEAIQDLNRSKTLSDQSDTRITLAKAYVRSGRISDAIIELRPVLDDPQSIEQAANLLDQIYLSEQRESDLVRLYTNMAERSQNRISWLNRAAAFELQKENFMQAEELYSSSWQESLETSAGNMDALHGLLSSLIAQEKYSRLQEIADRHSNDRFTPMVLFKQAEAKMKQDDRDAAVAYTREAVNKAAGDDAYVTRLLQRAYRLVGHEEVEQMCREFLEKDPDSYMANMVMFEISKLSGRYNRAIEYIDNCLDLQGSDNIVERIGNINRKVQVLQMAYHRTQDSSYLDKAIAEYESLVPVLPNNTNILNNIAYLLAAKGDDLEKATEYAERALGGMPNNPTFIDTYAYILIQKGDYEQAAQYIQQAIQLFEITNATVPADVYEHLGMAKEGLGEFRQAQAAYEQALELSSPEVNGRLKIAIERVSN